MKYILTFFVLSFLFVGNVSASATSTQERLIDYYSEKYAINSEYIYATMDCESGFNPKAVGDNGKSFGLAQIHLPSHRDITKKQALDQNFAIEWMVKQFSSGKANMWTCYRNLTDKDLAKWDKE